MTKLEEMQNKLASLITTMQSQLDSDQLDEAEQTKNEIKNLKNKISAQIFIDEAAAEGLKHKSTAAPVDPQSKENANFIRACIKKFSHRPLTEIEDSLLLPSATNENGANNEGYILPEDIQTKINKRVRDFQSFRSVLGYMKTSALKGSFPVENLDSLTGLVDFSDGTDGADSNDIKFEKISYALAEKAAFILLSNTLLELTDNDLVAYIIEVFAKKAVITENALAIAALQSNKTVKALVDWKKLKSSINKDLDPAALYNTVIVTNQDGFDYLDSQLDDTGRPLLQPDPTQPTVKRFIGYSVVVFSNAQLPSSAATTAKAGFAPIFYGDLSDGCKFVDLGSTKFATSAEAGFMKNATIARLIEFVTVVQCDKSDKCYIYGQLQVEDKKTA